MILSFLQSGLLAAPWSWARPGGCSAWPPRTSTAKASASAWAACPRRLRGCRPPPVIWLHAVSVGEVLAVSRLVAELIAPSPATASSSPPPPAPARRSPASRFGADRVFYCPLDLPWAVRLSERPQAGKLFILAETEFWPNLLSGCFRRGIPVAVVNARISDRSWPRYCRLRLWKPFLSRLSASWPRPKPTPSACSPSAAGQIASPSPAISSSMSAPRGRS
jgi:hypothetical protein